MNLANILVGCGYLSEEASFLDTKYLKNKTDLVNVKTSLDLSIRNTVTMIMHINLIKIITISWVVEKAFLYGYKQHYIKNLYNKPPACLLILFEDVHD